MKNFLLLTIFSFPLIIIFVERKNLRQKPVQYPINFPPSKTTFCGKKKDGKNNNEITIIPKKNTIENIEFLIIFIKSYIKSLSFCLFLITLIFDPLINNSIGFGLKL